MSIQPEVGPPTVPVDACGYSLDLDTPSCGRPCVIHLAVRSAAWGIVSLAACADHEDAARAVAEVLDEHAYTSACVGYDCWTVTP